MGKCFGPEHSVSSYGGENEIPQQKKSGVQSVKPDHTSGIGCCTSDLLKMNAGGLETDAKSSDNRISHSPSNGNAKVNLNQTGRDSTRNLSCRLPEPCDGQRSPEERDSACQDGCCQNDPNKSENQSDPSGKCSKELQDFAAPEKCGGTDATEGEERPCVPKTSTACFDSCCTSDKQLMEHRGSLTSNDMTDECNESGRGISGACQSHLESAFEKYTSYLKSGLCICRSALGSQEICCSRERRRIALRSKANGRGSKKSGNRSLGQMGAKCASVTTEISTSVPVVMTDRYPSRSDDRNGGTVTKRFKDVEKGESGNSTYVSMNISGMTCTSCAKKGINILNRIPGVAHPHVNFITSSGDFDIDPKLDAHQVISQFEHESGFKCIRVIQDNQALEVIMSKSEAQQLEAQMPIGVDSISKADKDSYSVKFDPAIIGARSVLSLFPSKQLAPPRNDGTLAGDRKRLHQMAWSTALAAVLTIPVVVLAWSHTPVPYSKRSIVSLVLATFVQAIAVPEFYVGALKSAIFSKVIEMDMLVVMSTTAAYGYSVIAFALTHDGYTLEQKEFFETSTLLITLVLAGRLVSVIARLRAVNAVSVKSLQGETALLVKNAGESSELDARLLQYDDNILVPSYARVVTDGEVISGSSAIDESMVTGESIPITKGPGDPVIAGTINGSSPLTIRLTRLPGKNSITDIANLVESALNAKPQTQELADMIASWFVPAVVAISIFVFVIWFIVALKIQNKNGGGSVGLAITYGIAVLAISCPCALGLAVPLVLIIAGGVAAKSGVVIKHATAIERAYRTTDVVFDKTGTLTTGVLEVFEEYYGPFLQPTEAKALVLSVVKDNGHPVSSAVAKRLVDEQATLALEEMQSIPGAGLQALWDGKVVKAGNPYWLGIDTRPEIDNLIKRGMTILGITVGSNLVAAYGLKSTLRPEAQAVIHKLLQRKITCHIVSGDGARVVQDIAQSVGVSEEHIASRQTPANKQEYVKNLINQGKRVLFCGDGTNDAVAIAQAHIGVQIGSASDVTRATANVVLVGGGLDGILVLLDISRRSFLRICINFAWSGIYNFFAILLAAGAFVKARVPPAYAGLGEIVSVLPVIVVAMSLAGFKRRTL